MADDPARAAGIMEGRVIALEQRMDRHEDHFERRIGSLDTKLDTISGVMSALQLSLATLAASIAATTNTGWRGLRLIGWVGGGIVIAAELGLRVFASVQVPRQ